MQEVSKFLIIGSNKSEDTQIAQKMLTYDGEVAYRYINVESAKWLKHIISRSEFSTLPIVFDYNYNLIGGLEDLTKFLNHNEPPADSNRLSALIRDTVQQRLR